MSSVRERERWKRERADLLYPVFPVVCAVISPPGTRYSTVPHHKEWHHLCDDLACAHRRRQNLREVTETEDSERSDSPEDGFEGMFFAWGTVLWTSS
jgi:hypothetical protein